MYVSTCSTQVNISVRTTRMSLCKQNSTMCIFLSVTESECHDLLSWPDSSSPQHFVR